MVKASRAEPVERARKPPWLRKKVSLSVIAPLKRRLRESRLNTVCESARCPNISDCFSQNLATVMILGDRCTRSCNFCAVKSSVPSPLDPMEPENTAKMIKSMGLKYAVITSVTRDDLPDGGARHYADTVRAVRRLSPGVKLELLVPDFRGSDAALKVVLDSKPDVLSHNVETVPSLYRRVRARSDFERSLALLRTAADYGITAKSGIMAGLGETEEELMSLFKRLKESGLNILTLGQYLAPSLRHAKVFMYRDEEWFNRMAQKARDIGIAVVFAGPYVRSSYMADDVYNEFQTLDGF